MAGCGERMCRGIGKRRGKKRRKYERRVEGKEYPKGSARPEHLGPEWAESMEDEQSWSLQDLPGRQQLYHVDNIS